MSLAEEIERAFEKPASALGPAEKKMWFELCQQLREGKVRAAECVDGAWRTNTWVKQGILVGMRVGELIEIPGGLAVQPFIEKDTMPPRPMSLYDKVRLVPGGASVRDGAYLAPGVIVMAPSYVNVGAYVDEGSLVDSNALVGSCAQIGKRVHLSAAAQIGGVLEPASAQPVIIEDDVLVGGNSGVYEGTRVCRHAVLGAGVVLTASTKVYDLVREKIYEAQNGILTIPENAVVIPGARKAKGAFAEMHGLSMSAPLIVKYRDDKTDARTALESAIRARD